MIVGRGDLSPASLEEKLLLSEMDTRSLNSSSLTVVVGRRCPYSVAMFALSDSDVYCWECFCFGCRSVLKQAQQHRVRPPPRSSGRW